MPPDIYILTPSYPIKLRALAKYILSSKGNKKEAQNGSRVDHDGSQLACTSYAFEHAVLELLLLLGQISQHAVLDPLL